MGDKGEDAGQYGHPSSSEPQGIFLRTNWQVQGYLAEQANAIEK